MYNIVQLDWKILCDLKLHQLVVVHSNVCQNDEESSNILSIGYEGRHGSKYTFPLSTSCKPYSIPR